MLEKLSAAMFSEQMGTKFVVREAEQPIELELCKVTERDTSPALEQFSLLFRGPLSPVLPQGIKKMEHAALGTVELFAVPVGPDGSGMCYEVIFSRFRKQEQPAK